MFEDNNYIYLYQTNFLLFRVNKYFVAHGNKVPRIAFLKIVLQYYFVQDKI
jgi:hypothetical protein